MIFRLGCLFILVPLLELVILVRIGQEVGLLPTLGLVIGSGLLGAFLARREGLRILRSIQSELMAGRLPTRSLLDAAAVLVGGALLLTPGILTDVVALGLLLPPTRRLFSAWIRSRMARALARGTLRVSVWGAGGPMAGPRAGEGGAGEGGAGADDDHGPSGSRPAGGPPTGPRPGEIIQD